MTAGNGPPEDGWEREMYPFLGDEQADDAGEPADPESVLDDVRSSTLQKSRDVTELRQRMWELHADDMVEMARMLAAAFAAGNKVLAFGNGGSATDAQDLVADLGAPLASGWGTLPAIDLTRDHGVVTAVSNDVAFENVFVRQVIAYGDPGDVAVGFSTSGESGNVIRAFEEAKRRGLKTLGFAGFDGGRMGEEGFLDACVVAPSHYIPRVQEAHATGYHAVLTMTHAILNPE